MITDYKSSDVRDPAQARQRAKDSLQLSIYAMGYEAMTGRLPDAVALHFLDSGLVGTAPVDRRRIDKAKRVDPHRRRRDPGPRLHGQARPPVVQLVRVPGDLPVQRGALTRGSALAADAPAGDRGRRRGRASAGAAVEADNLDALRSLPDACVDLAYADPPFATGGSQRLSTIRTGRGEQTRRGFGGRTYRYEVVSDIAWSDDLPLDVAPRGAPRPSGRGPPRPGGPRLAVPPRRLADRAPRAAAARRGLRRRTAS